MKNIFQIFISLLCILFAGNAFAQQQTCGGGGVPNAYGWCGGGTTNAYPYGAHSADGYAPAAPEYRHSDPNQSKGRIAVDWEKKVGAIAFNYQLGAVASEAAEATCQKAASGAECSAGYFLDGFGKGQTCASTYFQFGGDLTSPSLKEEIGNNNKDADAKMQLKLDQCNREGGDTACAYLVTYCTQYANHSGGVKSFRFALSPKIDAQYDQWLRETKNKANSTPPFLAFVLSPKERAFGGGIGKTELAAIQQAQKKCGKSDCVIKATVPNNTCIAASWGRKNNGENYDFVATGKYESEVKSSALKNCRTNAGNQCQVYYLQCTR